MNPINDSDRIASRADKHGDLRNASECTGDGCVVQWKPKKTRSDKVYEAFFGTYSHRVSAGTA